MRLLQGILRGLWRSSRCDAGLVFPAYVRGEPKGRSICAASCVSAHRFPHVYLARRVSTKVLLVRWRDFGSETLRPELFVEVTDVGRAQESELRSLDFAALLRHRYRTRPPPRSRGAHGVRYERTRFHSEKKRIKLTIKLLHNGAVAQSFTWKRSGLLHLVWPRKVLPCRGMGTTFSG